MCVCVCWEALESGTDCYEASLEGGIWVGPTASRMQTLNQSHCFHTHRGLKDFLWKFPAVGSTAHSVCVQSCLTLRPMDCSPPGSSLHGILQARILEWVAISFSGGIFSTQGLDHSLLTSPGLAGGFFTTSATWEACWLSWVVFVYPQVCQVPVTLGEFGHV